MEDSVRGGYNYIGTEHLLAGLLREGNNMAVRMLRVAGVDAKHLYTALMQKLGETPKSRAAENRAAAAREDGGKTKTLKEFTRVISTVMWKKSIFAASARRSWATPSGSTPTARG